MKRDKRRFLRASSAIEVWIGNDGIYSRKDERLTVLGAGGAFIATRRQYPVRSTLSLRFRLHDSDEYINCHALVRSAETGVGVGVEFADLTRDDQQRIRAFVENQLISEALQTTVTRMSGSSGATSGERKQSGPEPVWRAA
jgi:hypothetical protein